ncbi:response regulator [Paenibacillus athensensis]|uniref:AraC family transcriptional regulator n=1 Tax=Paenibacillus athensensis TaxID=1967502 RepID=A0A4Y8Q8E3_9BACL|nr:response regulator [Paenibacillus athensensis]MCD1257272.1 response regulator [Paenibacillus athensensis]
MNRLMIVDDEELIRESLAIQLSEMAGIAVSATLANGSKALEWLKEHYADLCVTDVRMPLVDGLQLIEEINRLYPWMTCVVISSYDDFQYAKKSMLLGAVDYVLKPIDPQLLGEAVDKALRKLHSQRRSEASQLLLRKLPLHKLLLEQWLELVLTVYLHGQPLLIVDTLDLLEQWVEGRYEQLDELALAWTELLVAELKKMGIEVALDETLDLGFAEAAPMLQRSQVRQYFRLRAVKRLEEAANLLMDRARKAKNLQKESAVDQVKRYIEQHYAGNWGLQDLADHVAMSRSYLAKMFKEQAGMTIWTYCVNVRMRKARELLLTTSFKSYEIALKVGYENSIHFSRIFKQYHGINPMEYKERFGGE